MTLKVIAMIAVASIAAVGQEAMHPSGPNLDSRYTVSDTLLALGDTLQFERRLTNNESYALTGVYLMENLPSAFAIVDETVTIDGSPVAFRADGPTTSQAYPGYNDYRWTIDSPDVGEALNRPLNPGEQLIIRYRVVSSDIGHFALPLHATVMYGNSTGLFATEGADSVRVVISLDTADPGEDRPLPTSFQLVSAFPNPFNAEVSIAYKGTGLANKMLRLEIYNTAGRLIASQSVKASTDEGILHWAPDLASGSGVYLYRLTADGTKVGGKLVLIK